MTAGGSARSPDAGAPALRVAVLRGGRSSEHEVSAASGAAVAAGLERLGFEVTVVDVGRDGAWRVDGEELELQPGRGLLGAAVVFPVLHGPFGEDGSVQGLLECLDVPYVGSGVLASALCMDKVAFKDRMALAGIPQVPYRALRDPEWRSGGDAVLASLERIGLPAWVKPARLGSSVGIVRVGRAGEMAAALDEAFRHDPLVIVEGHGHGLEVECSVLGNAEPVASAPGEIVLTEDGWYDYEAKYSPGGMELVVPARISQDAADRVRGIAVRAFELAGCAGLGRVDFFVDGDEVLLNELNTIPGFTDTSVFGKLLAASGVPYDEVLGRLVGLALDRHAAERVYVH